MASVEYFCVADFGSLGLQISFFCINSADKVPLRCIGHAGTMNLSGNVIDEAIMGTQEETVAAEMAKELHTTCTDVRTTKEWERMLPKLRKAAKTLKQKLLNMKSHEETFEAMFDTLDVTISLTDKELAQIFSAKAEFLLSTLNDCVADACSNTKLDSIPISKVLLTGGSSLLVPFRETFSAALKQRLDTHLLHLPHIFLPLSLYR